MDEKTQEIIAGIHDGTLAERMKMNMKFVTWGVVIGVVVGIVVAPMFGQGRFLMALGGAAVGGMVGGITSPKQKTEI